MSSVRANIDNAPQKQRLWMQLGGGQVRSQCHGTMNTNLNCKGVNSRHLECGAEQSWGCKSWLQLLTTHQYGKYLWDLSKLGKDTIRHLLILRMNLWKGSWAAKSWLCTGGLWMHAWCTADSLGVSRKNGLSLIVATLHNEKIKEQSSKQTQRG